MIGLTTTLRELCIRCARYSYACRQCNSHLARLAIALLSSDDAMHRPNLSRCA